MLVNYPAQFPQEAFLLVLDKVRGKDVPLSELLHAGWNVQGYAQGQIAGGGNAIGAHAAASGKDFETLLSEAIDDHAAETSGEKGLPFDVSWPTILKFVVGLLLSAALEA